jgi:predicted metalloprotease
MLWKGREQSGNVEDRRGSGGGRIAVGGGLGTIAIVVIALLLGKNPSQLLNSIYGGQSTEQTQQPSSSSNDAAKEFVSVVLKDNEDVWAKQFQAIGRNYEQPKLVLFTGAVESGCGNASSSTGPFYCPLDSKVYIDLAFFNELANRYGAGGDFANAYVIAHEVGHHVQNLLGTSDKVRQLQQQVGEREANQLSVRLELQADFYAGVWAHHAQEMKGILEAGDMEEALSAATAIGDDRLQKQAQGYVVPDAFTHGTSAQRVSWFKRGFETGDMRQGDTFGSDL